MDDAKSKKQGGTDACIWLSYTTAFTTGGRTHTIEMGIPMPIGASEEQREQLLREAEAGMGQLIGHVEQRISKMFQEVQPKAQTVETPSAPPAPMPKPAVRSAAIPAPQTTALPPQATGQTPQAPTMPLASQAQTAASSTREPQREPKPVAEEAPRRSDIGATMPRASVPVSASTGNLSLPDFVRYVREQFGLDPKQAMQMLNVTTLSRGINLREALEQLRRMVAQKSADTVGSREPQGREPDQENPPASLSALPPSVPLTSLPTVTGEKGPKVIAEQNTRAQLREVRPLVFDEEIEPDEENESDTLEDLDEPYELTEQSRSIAQSLIDRLRERRGTTNVSEARLRVLNNVMGDDISGEQLLDLVQGLWGVNALKKLKVDQVEELISWAKTDNFTSEVEAVLVLLEEDFYARGSR